MESEQIQESVKALAALCAIPVVIYAIWADAFVRKIRGQAPGALDKEEEFPKIQLAGFSLVMAELGIYFGNSDGRKAYPVVAVVCFLAALFFQSLIQAGAERALVQHLGEKPKADPTQAAATQGVAMLFWSLFSGALFLGVLYSMIIGSYAIGKLMGFSQGATALTMFAGGALGFVGGLLVCFAAAPILIRKTNRVKKIDDAETLAFYESCFNKAGIPMPEAWIIEQPSSFSSHAMVAGLPFGRGPFKPALFVCTEFTSQLTNEEHEAVILHEASHLALNHAGRRITLSSAMVMATAFFSAFGLIASKMLLSPAVAGFAGLFILGAMIFLPVTFVIRQSQQHEIEADENTLALGASADALIRALEKTDEARPSPWTADRIDRILKIKDKTIALKYPPKNNRSGGSKAA